MFCMLLSVFLMQHEKKKKKKESTAISKLRSAANIKAKCFEGELLLQSFSLSFFRELSVHCAGVPAGAVGGGQGQSG